MEMKADRIFETVVYSDDLEKAKSFYAGILNLDLVSESKVFLVFRLTQSVLLVFNPKLSGEKNRSVPSHGAIGGGHVAFGATQAEIAQWKVHFEEHGVEVEKMVDLKEGGASLYVRDPAGNSIEFAPSTLWGGNWDF